MGLYFNLSEEEREFARQKTMFCLIIVSRKPLAVLVVPKSF